MLGFHRRARLRSIGAAAAGALMIGVLAGACASPGQAVRTDESGKIGPGAPGAATAPAAQASCGRDEVMSRPCPQGAPKALPETADRRSGGDQARDPHPPRYKSDQGDAVNQYHGAAYRGQSYEYCASELAKSFQAYKSCVRY